MTKIEGAQKFGAQRRKRIRHMNRELNKINEKIEESEKKLENATSKLNIMKPAPLKRAKRMEKKIAEINRKQEAVEALLVICILKLQQEIVGWQ